jgi:uncharacterized Zn finger protein
MPILPACKKCGSKNVRFIKSWILQGGIKSNKFEIEMYQCRDCGKYFRRAIPIKEVSP